ncbi:hypothetical protein VEE05_13610 [Escherichia coli]|nr:hypothetical protein VEE05_13610 [Escherichia coli]
MDESRKKFEEYVAKKLRLPFEMITEARNGDRYFAFSSMDIRHSLNEWWALWQASRAAGNDSNLLIVFYVQIMPDDFVMQLHRF